MRILYAIQGTGNGHLSRAAELVPLFKQQVTTDVLVSGVQCELSLPFEVDYRLRGMSFIFGTQGGVDMWRTARNLSLRSFLHEVRSLPVEQYDLILSDFEPVSAWAARRAGKPCVALSHQSAVLHPRAPRPRGFHLLGPAILRYYAPANEQYGFHFRAYGEHVFPPILRKAILEQRPTIRQHYTVYLPAYSDEAIIDVLSLFPEVRWEVFSKHTQHDYHRGHVRVRRIVGDDFVRSLLTCEGVLCGAGFETPAEALHLGKKLLVVPMKNQYEQQCNAAALAEMGVPVLAELSLEAFGMLHEWINYSIPLQVSYPNRGEEIVKSILSRFQPKYQYTRNDWPGSGWSIRNLWSEWL